MSDFQQWYYINKEYKEDGPVSSDELREMARKGKIGRGTYVWTAELGADWIPASKIKGLFVEKEKIVVKEIIGNVPKKTAHFEVTSTRKEVIKDNGKPKISFKDDGSEPKPKDNITPNTVPPLTSTGDTSRHTITAASGRAVPAEPVGKAPTPMTAPQSIVPKPLTSRQPLRGSSPNTQPAQPQYQTPQQPQQAHYPPPQQQPYQQPQQAHYPPPQQQPYQQPQQAHYPPPQQQPYQQPQQAHYPPPYQQPQQPQYQTAANPITTNQAGKIPTPLSAPQSIVPSPLSSRQPIRGNATPTSHMLPNPGYQTTQMVPNQTVMGPHGIPAPQMQPAQMGTGPQGIPAPKMQIQQPNAAYPTQALIPSQHPPMSSSQLLGQSLGKSYIPQSQTTQPLTEEEKANLPKPKPMSPN